MSRISEFEMFSGSGEDRMLSQRGWWPCPPPAMHCKQTRTGEMEKGMMAPRAIHDGIAKKRRYFLGQRTEIQYPPGFFFFVLWIKLWFIHVAILLIAQSAWQKSYTEVPLVAKPPPQDTCC